MFSPGRTHRPRRRRRGFPEAMGQETWARATAAETGCQTSPKAIIMYGVPGIWNFREVTHMPAF